MVTVSELLATTTDRAADAFGWERPKAIIPFDSKTAAEITTREALATENDPDVEVRYPFSETQILRVKKIRMFLGRVHLFLGQIDHQVEPTDPRHPEKILGRLQQMMLQMKQEMPVVSPTDPINQDLYVDPCSVTYDLCAMFQLYETAYRSLSSVLRNDQIKNTQDYLFSVQCVLDWLQQKEVCLSSSFPRGRELDI